LLYGCGCCMDVVVVWMWLLYGCGCCMDVVVVWMWLLYGCLERRRPVKDGDVKRS